MVYLSKFLYVERLRVNVGAKSFIDSEVAFLIINKESIAKQMADECGGHIVVKNATFKDYIRQERDGVII